MDLGISDEDLDALYQSLMENSQDHTISNHGDMLLPNSPMQGLTADSQLFDYPLASPTTPQGYNYNPHSPALGIQGAQTPQNASVPAFGGFDDLANSNTQGFHFLHERDLFKDCHKMQLRISYQGISIGGGGRHDVESNNGFVLFYEQTCPGLPSSVTQFKLPPLNLGMADEKVRHLTMKVLSDMGKGLHIQYENGAIYATRYCASRVFVWSTQHENKTQTYKLEREIKTPVFCFQTFFDKISRLKKTGKDLKREDTPTIVFTFGQQWNGSSSRLRDMLVRAEVKPMKAVEVLLMESGQQHDLESINRSLNEGDIQVSVDPLRI